MGKITLDKETIRAIAEEVVNIMDDRRKSDMVTTEEAAKILGISPSWLRHTKDHYPHLKKGDDKNGRLLFFRDQLIPKWESS